MPSPPSSDPLFAENFKPEPYWWDTVDGVAQEMAPLPDSADVVIVGAGYTGLHAAIQAARGGRSALVLDAEDAGWGCSTRNGGQISTSLKPGLEALQKRYGADRGRALIREGQRSLEWIEEFISRERIDCDFQVCGRFHAAHNSAQFTRLARQAEATARDLGTGAYAVARSEQRRELGTDAYFGGVYYIGPIFSAFRGHPLAEKYYQTLRAEVEERMAAGKGPITPDGEMAEE